MKNFDASSIDVKLLKMFLSVYDSGSVTTAAEKLGCSQSAVSHSLERFRRCIGDPLFVKSGRGIRPTNFAVTIAPRIVEIVSQIEGLAQQKLYEPEYDRTQFTIATNVTELLPLLIQIKRALRRAVKHVHLRFVDLGPRDNALTVLNDGNADFAITAAIGQYPLELLTHRLYRDDFVCFFDGNQRDPPTSTPVYSAARHAVLDFGGNTKSIVDKALEDTSATRHVCLSAPNSFALAKLAYGTDIVVTLPSMLQTTAFKGFAICAPPIPLPPVSYDLVAHRRSSESSRHQWFKKEIQRVAAGFEEGLA